MPLHMRAWTSLASADESDHEIGVNAQASSTCEAGLALRRIEGLMQRTGALDGPCALSAAMLAEAARSTAGSALLEVHPTRMH